MSRFGGEAVPEGKRGGEPGVKNIAAWISIGAFLGALVWTAVSTPIYIEHSGGFFGKLPLQLLIALATSLPSSFSMIWLVRKNDQTIAKWFGPHSSTAAPSSVPRRKEEIGGYARENGSVGKRRWLIRAANAVTILSVGYGLAGFIWYLAHPEPAPLSSLPPDLIVWALNLPIFVFGIIWLTYQSTFVHIGPIERFAKRHTALWRVLSLLTALGGSALILLAIAVCSHL